MAISYYSFEAAGIERPKLSASVLGRTTRADPRDSLIDAFLNANNLM